LNERTPAPPGGLLEAGGMGRTRHGQPPGRTEPRHRAIAAGEIARLAHLPSDQVAAAVVAGVLILRTRGVGPLPIALAMAEALEGSGL